MACRYAVGMRIAYLVHFRRGRETGIYRKVREHVTEWTRPGADLGLFATDRSGRDDWASMPETKRIELPPGYAPSSAGRTPVRVRDPLRAR